LEEKGKGKKTHGRLTYPFRNERFGKREKGKRHGASLARKKRGKKGADHHHSYLPELAIPKEGRGGRKSGTKRAFPESICRVGEEKGEKESRNRSGNTKTGGGGGGCVQGIHATMSSKGKWDRLFKTGDKREVASKWQDVSGGDAQYLSLPKGKSLTS